MAKYYVSKKPLTPPQPMFWAKVYLDGKIIVDTAFISPRLNMQMLGNAMLDDKVDFIIPPFEAENLDAAYVYAKDVVSKKK